MVKKKATKKGKKKKKSTKEKGDDEDNKFQYDIPEYKDPKDFTPKVKLKV